MLGSFAKAYAIMAPITLAVVVAINRLPISEPVGLLLIFSLFGLGGGVFAELEIRRDPDRWLRRR